MSSTNKTNNLRLNKWTGSDIPKREDFNADNSIIDTAISTHRNNASIHASPEEKAVWSNPYFISSYMGTGASVKIIETNCNFIPSWGIIFAVNSPLKLVDVQNEASYNYFAFLINGISSLIGAELEDTKLKLVQSPVSVYGNEYRNFNENGVTYFYVLFR